MGFRSQIAVLKVVKDFSTSLYSYVACALSAVFPTGEVALAKSMLRDSMTCKAAM